MVEYKDKLENLILNDQFELALELSKGLLDLDKAEKYIVELIRNTFAGDTLIGNERIYRFILDNVSDNELRQIAYLFSPKRNGIFIKDVTRCGTLVLNL